MLVLFFNIEILASFTLKYNTRLCMAGDISLPEHHYPQALCQGITLHGHSYGEIPAHASFESGANSRKVDIGMGDIPAPTYGLVTQSHSRNTHSWHLNTSATLKVISDLLP